MKREDDRNSLTIVVAMGKKFVVDEDGYHEIRDDYGIPQYTAKKETEFGGCYEYDRHLSNLTRALYDDVKNGVAYHGKKVAV